MAQKPIEWQTMTLVEVEQGRREFYDETAEAFTLVFGLIANAINQKKYQERDREIYLSFLYGLLLNCGTGTVGDIDRDTGLHESLTKFIKRRQGASDDVLTGEDAGECRRMALMLLRQKVRIQLYDSPYLAKYFSVPLRLKKTRWNVAFERLVKAHDKTALRWIRTPTSRSLARLRRGT